MEIPEKILERLKKLLNLKEDAERRNSQAELENAVDKIQNILLQYNLSLDSLDRADKPKVKNAWMNQPPSYFKPKNEGPWIITLYRNLGEHFLVKVLFGRNFEAVMLVGEPQNIEVFPVIVDYIIEQARSLARTHIKQVRAMTPDCNPNAHKRAYLEGLALGISDKLRKAEDERTYEPSTSVMIINKLEVIEDYVKTHIKTVTKTTKQRELQESYSTGKGYHDAHKVNLNRNSLPGYRLPSP